MFVYTDYTFLFILPLLVFFFSSSSFFVAFFFTDTLLRLSFFSFFFPFFPLSSFSSSISFHLSSPTYSSLPSLYLFLLYFLYSSSLSFFLLLYLFLLFVAFFQNFRPGGFSSVSAKTFNITIWDRLVKLRQDNLFIPEAFRGIRNIRSRSECGRRSDCIKKGLSGSERASLPQLSV